MKQPGFCAVKKTRAEREWSVRRPEFRGGANMLQMPRYSSKDSLAKQLRKATELCDGFQIL
ncbi:unnamed protein product [Effrenium voratum]|nr:unnamed protein product [Effrenium voratum]